MNEYYEHIMQAAARLGLIHPNSANMLQVQHDEWCPLRQGVGQCECNPVIVLFTPSGAYEVKPAPETGTDSPIHGPN